LKEVLNGYVLSVNLQAVSGGLHSTFIPMEEFLRHWRWIRMADNPHGAEPAWWKTRLAVNHQSTYY